VLDIAGGKVNTSIQISLTWHLSFVMFERNRECKVTNRGMKV